MTAYTPPTREELRLSISRDLHDPNNNAFTSAEVDDMVNGGIAELNLLRAKEFRTDVVLIEDTWTYDLDPSIDDLFRVELWRRNHRYTTIPHHDGDEMLSGWDYFSGVLYLPDQYVFTVPDDTLTVWGYQNRNPLMDDAEVLDADLTGEHVIRAYCQQTAFERLLASRSLFAQWQQQANNSDVSATQLIQMAGLYASEWRALRMRVRLLRRPS